MCGFGIFALFSFSGCTQNISIETKVVEKTPKARDLVLWIAVDGLRDLETAPVALSDFQKVNHAWADSPWRVPTMISAFLGKPVLAHGWNSPRPAIQLLNGGAYPPMPAGDTIAEMFKRNGFKTLAIHAEDGSLIDDIDRGFDRWRNVAESNLGRVTIEEMGSLSNDQKIFVLVWSKALTQPLNPSVESKMSWGVDDKFLNSQQGIRHDRIGVKNAAAQKAYVRAYSAKFDDLMVSVNQILQSLPETSGRKLIVISGTHGVELGGAGRFGNTFPFHPTIYRTSVWISGAHRVPTRLSSSQMARFFDMQFQFNENWTWRLDEPLMHQVNDETLMSIDGEGLLHWNGKIRTVGTDLTEVVSPPKDLTPYNRAFKLLWGAEKD